LRRTCRDATRLIDIDEPHNMLGERGGIVVSTSKLSAGVNVPTGSELQTRHPHTRVVSRNCALAIPRHWDVQEDIVRHADWTEYAAQLVGRFGFGCTRNWPNGRGSLWF
jgi:hypothetical protein